MKIEQAVEKVMRNQRKTGWRAARNAPSAPRTNAASAPRTNAPSAPRTIEGAEGKWMPPSYSESQRRTLDPRILQANRCVCYLADAPELDFYKVLRTQLIQNTQARGWNTIMITSTRPGEGKTVTAINLAMTFAKAYNQTVLLMDCDLRQQKVYRYLGMASEMGIIDHLMNGCPLKDMIIWPGIDKMTVISGGRTVNESAELLGSPKMKALIGEMKSRYADRYILLDAPPVLSGADALTLSEVADGIVMVVESGKTPVKEIQEALALLPDEKFLGFVLNKHASANKGYYNYYALASND
jgi:protein-tyrosine kinase